MRRTALSLVIAVVGACDDAQIADPLVVDDLDADVADGSAPDASDPDARLPAMLDAGRDGALDAYVPDTSTHVERDAAVLPYARNVVSFREGSNAGFGRNSYPGVVLGPPSGKGNNAGGLDVLSLGVGGEIVLDFGACTIVDGAGPDFIVFENPFWAGGLPAGVFAELGEVSVSNDLTTWQTFPCSRQPTQPGVYPGCAGWTPTLEFDPLEVVPLDPTKTGGDAFDLATLSVPSARYVRVRDLATSGQGMTAGFDLDAIGIIHSAAAR